MLEELVVVAPGEAWKESARGPLSAALAGEFPTVSLRFAPEPPRDSPRLEVSAPEWQRTDFDSWSFDCRADDLGSGPFVLCVHEESLGGRAVAMEVLSRCQRHVRRRNRHSRGSVFERALERHRQLHDLSMPLVRADYNHALDVWQWMLRLDGEAPLELQLAALFHDVERLVSEAGRRVEHLAADYQEFKDAHARAGAAMAGRVLAEAGAGEPLRAAVAELIGSHERKSDDPGTTLLNDADALSFFSLNSPGYADYFGSEQAAKKVAWTWHRMSERARARLAGVRLRPDVRRMLEQAKT